MNIVYVGAFRFPIYDAAAARVINNAKALKGIGHNVTIISWGGKYRDEDLCPDGKYRFDGIIYIITNEIDSQGGSISKIKNSLTRGKKSLEILRNHANPIDIIILYNASYGWGKKMRRYCDKRHIYLINDITEWYANNELYFFQRIPNYINMKIAQHKIHNKILISSYLNNCYPESNNIIIPPLCDKTEEKWRRIIEDERIKDFDGISLIYAGNPGRKDCLHTVIDTINEMAYCGKKIRFLILGCEKETYISEYRDQIKSKFLHSNILFLGRVPQDLIPAYYKKADFMVMLRKPTRKNMAGFPTKVAESFVAGIPVITNDTSDICEYVIDNKTGFIVPGYNSKDLRETLLNKVLPLNKEKLARMKNETLIASESFNYQSYDDVFKGFISRLK